MTFNCQYFQRLNAADLRTSAELATLANGTTSHDTELEDDTYPDGTYQVGIFPHRSQHSSR